MNENNDKLRDLFKQLKTEVPSSDFNGRLMLKITKHAEARAKKRKISRLILISMGVAGGLVGVFGLTGFLFSYYDITIDEPQLAIPAMELNTSSIDSIEFPPMLVMLAVAVLLLLGTDLLMRRHRLSKRQKV